MDIKNELKKQVSELTPRLIGLRQHLHSHPELSHKEFETASKVDEELLSVGVTAKPIANTGRMAILGSGTRQIGIRCDLDALPVVEENEIPYASKSSGVMHACGHDVHTTVVTGTALVLGKIQDKLKGKVKFIFQPAEEALAGGADRVVEEGHIDDVEAMFSLHVDPSIPVGKFGLKDGAMMASVDFFEVTIRGKGGHGARPHEAVDPIFVATQVANALYQINGRLFSPLENPVILSIGEIRGGDAYNVIPETCTFKGTFRSFDDADRTRFRLQVETTTRAVCTAWNASCKIHITPNAPPVINDPRLGAIARETVTEVFGADSIVDVQFPMMASEDFAYYRQKCPIYFVRIGTCSGESTAHPLHHPKFNVDESMIPRAVEFFSNLLIRYFESPKVADS